VTVLLSVVRFGHVVNFEQWCGIGMVFVSLSFEIFMKYRDSSKAAAAAAEATRKRKEE
jgi:drug/metabolite transporter (DMT)-like permease